MKNFIFRNPDEKDQPEGGQVGTDPEQKNTVPGVGESATEQAAPRSIAAKEKMIEIIAHTRGLQADAQALLDILNEKPELDAAFCRLFNILPKGQFKA